MKLSRAVLCIFLISLFLPVVIEAADQPQGNQGTLGVLLGEIPLPLKQLAGMPQLGGAMVQQVLPNGAGARAGLLPGDWIIAVDDAPVASATDAIQRIEKHAAGETMGLTLLRSDWLGGLRQIQVRPVLLPAATGPALGLALPQTVSPFPAAKPGRPTEAWLGVKFNVMTQPVKIHFNEYHTCYAVGPADWFVWGHRKEGDAIDLGAPDFSYASWFILSVHGFARAAPQYTSPEAYIQWSLSGGWNRQPLHVTYGEPIQDEFGYIWLPFVKEEAKPPAQGIYIYRVLPVPNDPRGYILISRIVQMPKQLWERKGAQALMVALSIRCNVQLHASPGSPARPRSVDDKEESTYNQQLGTEYAHNPETGDVYWMNRASDWRETGPQGPGYYIHSGNELKKLEEGLGR